MLSMVMSNVCRPPLGSTKVNIFGCSLYLSTVSHIWVAADNNGFVYLYAERPSLLYRDESWVGMNPRMIGCLNSLDDRFDCRKLFIINENNELEEVM